MSEQSEKNIKQALYVAVANKLQGDLSELEAKEILLTSNPAYITSKEHDHAEHIEELYRRGMYQMTRKIVSGVTKYKEKNEQGEVVDCLKIHYTDGTSKDFTVAEWEYSFNEGRRLWQQHEKDFNEQ
jgi:hypothetical protein